MKNQQWIKVEDELPEVDTPVWYFFDMVGVWDGKYLGISDWEEPFDDIKVHVFGGTHGALSDDVTHWMPLTETKPEPPIL